MAKTVALQSPGTPLATLLEARGYQVIDLHSAACSQTHVDAWLYTGHHPDIIPTANLTETADISLGGTTMAPDEFPGAFTLNVGGMLPEKAVDALECRLRRRHWHH
ncbi:MAG: hypothetical protein P4N59_12075 [Negativicutes bacterium]|nr:hypothetical protein [Negativicutes bacterium]